MRRRAATQWPIAIVENEMAGKCQKMGTMLITCVVYSKVNVLDFQKIKEMSLVLKEPGGGRRDL